MMGQSVCHGCNHSGLGCRWTANCKFYAPKPVAPPEPDKWKHMAEWLADMMSETEDAWSMEGNVDGEPTKPAYWLKRAEDES